MALRNKPKWPGYWPNTPTQWREPTVDDCTWYATEFAFQSAGEPHLNFHPVRDIRSKSSDTVGGTPVSVALRETMRLWPDRAEADYVYGAYLLSDVKRALHSGAVVVVGGDYEKLPAHYRRWTNNDTFDHAMAHKFLLDDGSTGLYDPLGGGPQRAEYDGEWIKLWNLYGEDKFVWRARGKRFYVGFVENKRLEWAVGKVTVDPAAATRGLLVKRGTPVYNRPTVTGRVIRKLWNDARQWKTVLRGPNGWRLIIWTGNDGILQEGWVAKADIKRITDIQPTQPKPPESPDPTELEATLYDQRIALEAIKLTATEALDL